MPLPKRCVEPVLVSRGTVPERHSVPSELEAVTNGTLANTVRQLSSLSRHAEDMFGELTRDASALAERTNVLQARIDRLAVRVTQLDSTVEEVSLQDIQLRKAFRSSRAFTQQVLSRASMPSAMRATYARCDPPPPLERLNEFRDDGRDARKFYTDPGYFFELWRREMLQDTERIQHDRGKKVRQPRAGGAGGRAGGRVRAPHSTRERQRAAAVTRGEHLMPQPAPAYVDAHYREPSAVDGPGGGGAAYRAGQARPASQAQRPCSIEISDQPYRQPRVSTGNGHVMGEESPYGPGSEPIYGGSLAGTPRRARPSVPPPAPPAPLSLSPPTANHTPTRSALPPPPPPPEGASPPPLMNGAASPPPPPQPARTTLDAHLDHMQIVMDMMTADPEECEAPPPPPPPPPPAPLPSAAAARPAPPSAAELQLGASTLRSAPLQPPPPPDPRTDLLQAIRDGIKLRKVEKCSEEDSSWRYKLQPGRGAPAAPEMHDVAYILARRFAFHASDSEEESEQESVCSEVEWGTESHA